MGPAARDRGRRAGVCTQMLIRGANAVGYTSYHDTVVARFVELAARNGLDVFRIFDCFNDVEQMRVTIDAVRAARKVAEVCICYTADCLSSRRVRPRVLPRARGQVRGRGART